MLFKEKLIVYVIVIWDLVIINNIFVFFLLLFKVGYFYIYVFLSIILVIDNI